MPCHTDLVTIFKISTFKVALVDAEITNKLKEGNFNPHIFSNMIDPVNFMPQ